VSWKQIDCENCGFPVGWCEVVPPTMLCDQCHGDLVPQEPEPERCDKGRYCGQRKGHEGECDDLPF